jgi:anti-anti-sigma regulatory factor
MNELNAGRVFLIRSGGSLDGVGSTPEEVATHASNSGARYLIIDATDAAYVDTPGIRWLISFRSILESMGKKLRIVTPPKSRVTRNLELLDVKIDRYENLATAWKTPWSEKSQETKRKRAA